MAIDFTLSPELEAIRERVRTFIDEVVRPGEAQLGDPDEIERDEYLRILFGMRDRARDEGLWLPHMPAEWGGMGWATSSWRCSRPRPPRPTTGRSS
jgi:acyl-CoA dehydrogenase